MGNPKALILLLGGWWHTTVNQPITPLLLGVVDNGVPLLKHYAALCTKHLGLKQTHIGKFIVASQEVGATSAIFQKSNLHPGRLRL